MSTNGSLNGWELVRFRKDFTDENVYFSGDWFDWPAFLEGLNKLLYQKGLGNFLHPLDTVRPLPDVIESVDSDEGCRDCAPDVERLTYNLKVWKVRSRMNREAEDACITLYNKLDGYPEFLVWEKWNCMDANYTPQKKFYDMLTILKEYYGSKKESISNQFRVNLDFCPVVDSFDEAELLVRLIITTKLDLTIMNASDQFKEFDMLSILVNKLSRSKYWDLLKIFLNKRKFTIDDFSRELEHMKESARYLEACQGHKSLHSEANLGKKKRYPSNERNHIVNNECGIKKAKTSR